MASQQELIEMNEIWQMVMNDLRGEMSDSTVELFFAPLVLESYENNTVTFSTDSSLKHGIINDGHIPRMQNGFAKLLGFPISVEVRYSGTPREVVMTGGASAQYNTEEKPLEQIVPKFKEAVEFGSESMPFHFEYTFENFIVGASNKFAHAACLSVASNPAFYENDPEKANVIPSTYNPLFIYGPSGLGKTHLLHAIVNKIRKNSPEAKILYIRSEDFTNQLIDHLARGTMPAFKEKYRKCDVLLIDDIQFISNKPSTQEEFFHTFNSLYEEHKQIILTSDCPPCEIDHLEERLVTRFEWGVIGDIQPPDFELRLAIIKKKAEEAKITLPEEVAEFIAENLRSNVRQIEGIIKKLGALVFLSGRSIDIDLARACIIELMGGEEPISVTVDKVFAVIKRIYHVEKEELLSDSRKKEVAGARHIAVYLIRKMTDMSFPHLAKTLKRKNHTTCISSYQNVEERIKTDMAFNTEIQAILKELSGK